MPENPPDWIVDYFADRVREQDSGVDRALNTMTVRERNILLEAAVMGFVRGTLASGRQVQVPSDSTIVTQVILACRANPDLYPVITAATDGRRRRGRWNA